MSGITLRQDDYDDISIAINNVVYRKVEQMPNVHHVYNGNLRQRRFYESWYFSFQNRNAKRSFSITTSTKKL